MDKSLQFWLTASTNNINQIQDFGMKFLFLNASWSAIEAINVGKQQLTFCWHSDAINATNDILLGALITDRLIVCIDSEMHLSVVRVIVRIRTGEPGWASQKKKEKPD